MSSVQKEMASLNKRSKDNYGDLMSLKEATSVRDEDIRKSLKELVSGLETKFTHLDSRLLGPAEASRSTPNLAYYLEDKPHTGSPRPKSLQLPRIGSPSSFSAAFDRDLTASPSLTCVDGAASIALLEKVLREMATREGQDKIMGTLEAVKSQALVRGQSTTSTQATFDPVMMSKLEDILMLMKDMKQESGSRALIRANGNENDIGFSNLNLYLDAESKAGPLAKAKASHERRPSMSGAELSGIEEIVTMLKSVKQSLAQGGGLTNEVKLLVRDLRGEVLGMGREIAKKLERTIADNKDADPKAQIALKGEVALIVQQGLLELKTHMHNLAKESQQRSIEAKQPPVDTQEIVRAVSTVIAQIPQHPTRDVAAEREEMLAAVREAWEDCKPEIALEHFGLERDEILETLNEGLKSYQPIQSAAKEAGASYEDVLEAVRRGFAEFEFPQISPPSPGLTREEVHSAVSEGLRNIEWPDMGSTQRSVDVGLTRDDIVEAVRAGLTDREAVTPEQIAEAVRQGLAQP